MIRAEKDFVVFDVEELMVVPSRQIETQAPVFSLCIIDVYSFICLTLSCYSDRGLVRSQALSITAQNFLDV